MVTISLKLPEPLNTCIEALAHERHESKSEFIRRAIERELIAQSSVSGGSCAEAAAKYAGCLHGPDDLSTNKDYLKGFGT